MKSELRDSSHFHFYMKYPMKYEWTAQTNNGAFSHLKSQTWSQATLLLFCFLPLFFFLIEEVFSFGLWLWMIFPVNYFLLLKALLQLLLFVVSEKTKDEQWTSNSPAGRDSCSTKGMRWQEVFDIASVICQFWQQRTSVFSVVIAAASRKKTELLITSVNEQLKIRELKFHYVLNYQLSVIKIQIQMIKANPVTDQFHCHFTSNKTFVKVKMINQEHI